MHIAQPECCTKKTSQLYYTKVNLSVLQTAHDKILNIVNEGFDNVILSKEEASAMTPAEDVIPGRFYTTFKVHKQYEHGKAPPERALEEKVNSAVPGYFIARLLKIILQNSIFEFNNELYKQEVGTTMGTKQAPSYANMD